MDDGMNRQNCKLSVIIPVYNMERSLEKCVASVLGQTMEGLELILVDDGSTDGSPAIVDRLAVENPNVRAVHQPNSKQGAARNRGIEAAAGEYVAFVDADDCLRGDLLGAMHEAARAEGLDMLASSIIRVDEKGAESEISPLPQAEGAVVSGADYIRRFGYKVQPTVVAYLYRRAFLNENGLRFVERTYSEDCLFVAQCVTKARRILCHRYAHYVYLYNESSTTRRANAKLCFDNIDIGLKIAEYARALELEGRPAPTAQGQEPSDVACPRETGASAREGDERVRSALLKYAAYVAHSSLTKAAEQGLPAAEILVGENRARLLAVLRHDKKYRLAMLSVRLRLENLYQWLFLKKLIGLKRRLLRG